MQESNYSSMLKANVELMKVIQWLMGGDTGASSIYLCKHMLGIANTSDIRIPLDAVDRGRCIRLLNLFPQWWDRLDELANLPKVHHLVFDKSGIHKDVNGWKQQILLIREEAGKT